MPRCNGKCQRRRGASGASLKERRQESHAEDDEPALASPAKKPARPAAKPIPRGEPAAKRRQAPVAELSPASLEARRKRDRGYAKSAYARQTAAAEPLPAVDETAYAVTKTGKARSGLNAEKNAKQRNVAKLCDAVESLGGEAQQVVSVRDAMQNKRLRRTAVAAGFHSSEELHVALYNQQQQGRMLQRALATEKPRGRADDDRRGFVESVILAQAESPPWCASKHAPAGGAIAAPSLAARARAAAATDECTALAESSGGQAAEAHRGRVGRVVGDSQGARRLLRDHRRGAGGAA